VVLGASVATHSLEPAGAVYPSEILLDQEGRRVEDALTFRQSGLNEESSMSKHAVTRRQAMAMVGAGALVGLTGCGPRANDVVGDALIHIGGLVLKIPHLAGKIIGALLMSSGTALKLYVVTTEGLKSEVEIELTEEQQKKIREALEAGKTFTVKQPDGSKETIKAK
jgi:hypothetical protein